MPPKRRKKQNKPYPTGWRWKCGAIRYRVPAGLEYLWDGKKEFTLGKTEVDAYQTWSNRLELQKHAVTINDLCDRYVYEVVPKKAPKTQQSNHTSLKRIRAVFGENKIIDMKPSYARIYRDKIVANNGPASARRDLEVLSHMYTEAVEWGLLDVNPIKGNIRKPKVGRRERYVEDWELNESLTVASPMLRAYIVLKLLTGLRRGDLLRLRIAHLLDDGIHVQPHKTAKTSGIKIVIEWTDELRQAVDAALHARPKDIAPWLFCTNVGNPYVKEDGSANAFDSLWQRFMAKVIKQTKVTEKFQEKDLRKKAASDTTLEHAAQLLTHTSQETTKRHYRLLGETVKPRSLK